MGMLFLAQRAWFFVAVFFTVLIWASCVSPKPPKLPVLPSPPLSANHVPPVVPSAECRWATGPIQLDGRADEPAWAGAEVFENYHLNWLGTKDRPAKTKTRTRLLWDSEFLYFTAEMEDADLFADVVEHDVDTWYNDVWELFLKPAGDRG